MQHARYEGVTDLADCRGHCSSRGGGYGSRVWRGGASTPHPTLSEGAFGSPLHLLGEGDVDEADAPAHQRLHCGEGGGGIPQLEIVVVSKAEGGEGVSDRPSVSVDVEGTAQDVTVDGVGCA